MRCKNLLLFRKSKLIPYFLKEVLFITLVFVFSICSFLNADEFQVNTRTSKHQRAPPIPMEYIWKYDWDTTKLVGVNSYKIRAKANDNSKKQNVSYLQ